jgi:hypothetical protein
LPGNFTLDVAYVGSRAISGSANLNYNASPLLGCGRDCQPWYVQYGRTASVNYPVYDHQWYNALQVKFDRRFSGGFMMTTAYTYSRNIDQFLRSAQATPGEPDIIQFLDRKRADIDYTHIFTQSYIYQLPFGRGKRWGQSGFLGAVLGGWQINALLNLQSGAPLDLGASSSRLQTTGHSTEPNLIGSEPVEISGNVGPGQLWFDTSRFESPPSLTFGNFGQNVFEGPGVVNLDASLFRRFQVKEGITMEFRFEALNATNTPHFGNPNTSVTSSSFGQITDSRHTTNYDTDNRRVQLGLRLFF